VKDREGERVDNAEPSVPPNYTAVQTHANPENKLYLLCKLAAYWRTERTGFVTTRVRDGGGERGWKLRGVEARDQPEGGREALKGRGRKREKERDYRGSIAYFESGRWCTHRPVNTAYCCMHTAIREKFIYMHTPKHYRKIAITIAETNLCRQIAPRAKGEPDRNKVICDTEELNSESNVYRPFTSKRIVNRVLREMSKMRDFVESIRILIIGRLIISKKRIDPPTCVGFARNWPVIEINKNIDLSCPRGEMRPGALFAMTDEGVSRARSILEGRENQGGRG